MLTIEAKNNYEYLLFEDLKPAGLEAVEVRSGEALYAYELKSGAVSTQVWLLRAQRGSGGKRQTAAKAAQDSSAPAVRGVEDRIDLRALRQ